MKYVSFLFLVYLLSAAVYAGADDKWVYVGPSVQLDGIAFLLAIGMFAWAAVIYKDMKISKRHKRK